MNIEDRISLYPELSAEERAEVDDYVDLHPEWRAALDEARLWTELLEAARTLGEDPPGRDALAYYAATRNLSFENAPPVIADTVLRLRARIEADPDLSRRAETMMARKNEMDSESPAAAHFERLTGRSLADIDAALSGKESASDTRPALPRRKARSVSKWPLGRAATAVAALVAVYGLLLIAGHLSRPSHERLASFEAHEISLEGYETQRGMQRPSDSNPAIDRYLAALQELRRAETSFLGLFPSFVPERLDSAAILLSDVIEQEPQGSFLSNEATYLLGKTELARGNIDEATRALSEVVDSQGLRADDAHRILSGLN